MKEILDKNEDTLIFSDENFFIHYNSANLTEIKRNLTYPFKKYRRLLRLMDQFKKIVYQN